MLNFVKIKQLVRCHNFSIFQDGGWWPFWIFNSGNLKCFAMSSASNLLADAFDTCAR